MLQAVAIKGTHAYLPNTCASPDGPVRFNVNVQSCLSVLDTTTDAEGTVGGRAADDQHEPRHQLRGGRPGGRAQAPLPRRAVGGGVQEPRRT
jgi:hypothetical protein